MKYRKLGNSGLKVSEISLGTWLSCDDLAAKEKSIEIIDTAVDCGINFFDTANAYSSGRAEIILGEALKKYPRSSYVLATKVYWAMGQGPNERGLSRKHIFDQVTSSLKRLDMDYIDVYYCHWFDNETPIEETLRALDDLIKQGKIRYFGVSNWTALQMSRASKVIDKYLLNKIIVNEPSYNIFDRYIEKETIPFCEENGIGLAVYSPLAQGLLSGKYKKGMKPPEESRANNKNSAHAAITLWDYINDEILDAVEKLEIISKDMGISLSQLSLSWLLKKKAVSSVIIGASKPSQIIENVKAVDVMLSDEGYERILKITDSCKFTIKHNVVEG